MNAPTRETPPTTVVAGLLYRWPGTGAEDQLVPVQDLSLAPSRSSMWDHTVMSDLLASWKIPAHRPRPMHWAKNDWWRLSDCVPASRLSTVSAARAPCTIATWRLIRSGWSDGAAESPAATMRGSSTLVSVSSVSRRPRASVLSLLRAARCGTPNPVVQMVTWLGSSRPCASRTASRVTAVTLASAIAGEPGRSRRPRLLWPPTRPCSRLCTRTSLACRPSSTRTPTARNATAPAAPSRLRDSRPLRAPAVLDEDDDQR